MNHTNNKVSLLGLTIFFLAACFYLYDSFLQIFPSVITHQLMNDFAINATMLGLMVSVYFYICAIAQIPVGIIIDKYGAHKIVSAAFFLSAFGALIFVNSTHLYGAILGRVFMGCGASFAFVSTLYLTGNWLPPKYFALFVGYTELIASLGSIIGQAPLSHLIAKFGWRESIAYFATFGLIFAFLFFLIVRDHPNPRFLKNKNAYENKIFNYLKIVFKKPQNWFITLYVFVSWAPITTFGTLWGVPALMKINHLSKTTAADAMIFLWIGVAIGSPFVCWLSNTLGYRKPLLLLPELIGLFSMLSIIFIPVHLSTLCILLLLIGFAGSGQTLSFAVVRENNSERVTSSASGLINMATYLGGALLEPIVGRILDITSQNHIVHSHHFYSIQNYQTALFAVLPICYIIGIIVSLYFIKETHCAPIIDENIEIT